jgi:hypothetical protein
VIDDVRELLVKQARVDRVNDCAHAGHGVVEFEVAIAVPRERADAIAASHAKSREGARELPRARVGGAVRIAMDRPLHGTRYDLGVAMEAIRMVDQRRDRKRHVHHQALHRSSCVMTLLAALLSVRHRGVLPHHAAPATRAGARVRSQLRRIRVFRDAPASRRVAHSAAEAAPVPRSSCCPRGTDFP